MPCVVLLYLFPPYDPSYRRAFDDYCVFDFYQTSVSHIQKPHRLRQRALFFCLSFVLFQYPILISRSRLDKIRRNCFWFLALVFQPCTPKTNFLVRGRKAAVRILCNRKYCRKKYSNLAKNSFRTGLNLIYSACFVAAEWVPLLIKTASSGVSPQVILWVLKNWIGKTEFVQCWKHRWYLYLNYRQTSCKYRCLRTDI